MISIIPVNPIGTRTSNALVHRESGCAFETVTEPSYPPSKNGERLQRQRAESEWTLREFAKYIGITPTQLSDLEAGRATLSAADWVRVITEVRFGKKESKR